MNLQTGFQVKSLAIGLALALATLGNARASDWLFFDQEERFSIEFPTDATYTLSPAQGPNAFILDVNGPITIGRDQNYADDGYVETAYIGGDFWYLSFGSPILGVQNTWIDSYFFDKNGPTAGVYRAEDAYYIQDDPNTWHGFHDTKLVVCNTDTPGCSVSGILAAPEPSTWALLMFGIAALGSALRFVRAKREDRTAALAT